MQRKTFVLAAVAIGVIALTSGWILFSDNISISNPLFWLVVVQVLFVATRLIAYRKQKNPEG